VEKKKNGGKREPFLSKERIRNWVTVFLPFLNRKIVVEIRLNWDNPSQPEVKFQTFTCRQEIGLNSGYRFLTKRGIFALFLLRTGFGYDSGD